MNTTTTVLLWSFVTLVVARIIHHIWMKIQARRAIVSLLADRGFTVLSMREERAFVDYGSFKEAVLALLLFYRVTGRNELSTVFLFNFSADFVPVIGRLRELNLHMEEEVVVVEDDLSNPIQVPGGDS